MTDDADAPVDEDAAPATDPMQATIRSDEEKLRAESLDGDGSEERTTSTTTTDAPDPTDAPDLTGSAIEKLSRFGLAGSLVNLVVALAAVLLAVLSPDRVSGVLGRAIGAGLILWSVDVWAGLRRHSDRRWQLASLLVGIASVGLLLLLQPQRWLEPIGWIIGVVLVIAGLRRLVEAARTTAPSRAPIVRGFALIGAGALAYVAFAALFETLAVTIAIVAVANALVGVAVRSGFTTVAPRGVRRRPMLIRWIDGKSRDADSRQSVNSTVFFEGAEAPARLTRFMLMMLFASVISGAGVLSDSTAVVIGAMLIAPLITPMMGMGLALVAGWPNRLGRSALVVLAGSVVAVATGLLLAAATDITVDLQANTQIVSRSSPGVIDLLIAVGAGLAGAYALSRKDVSSSLPGVAVAIALVPPLSVVGVTAEAGDWRQASGTLLLFLTNLIAIILAGGLVFLLTGVVPLRRFAENQHRVRTALGAVTALAVVVIGSLILNGRQITEDALDLEQARSVVIEWLGDDTEFTVMAVDVIDGDVEVVLAGPGDPPSPDDLASDLSDRLGGGLQLDLQWIPRQRVVVTDR